MIELFTNYSNYTYEPKDTTKYKSIMDEMNNILYHHESNDNLEETTGETENTLGYYSKVNNYDYKNYYNDNNNNNKSYKKKTIELNSGLNSYKKNKYSLKKNQTNNFRKKNDFNKSNSHGLSDTEIFYCSKANKNVKIYDMPTKSKIFI